MSARLFTSLRVRRPSYCLSVCLSVRYTFIQNGSPPTPSSALSSPPSSSSSALSSATSGAASSSPSSLPSSPPSSTPLNAAPRPLSSAPSYPP